MFKLALAILFLTKASSYQIQGRGPQCPWSDDGKTLLVYNGIECVEPPTLPPTQSQTQMFKCPKLNGNFKCPESKSKYYNCRNGISSLENCPKNTTFDGKESCVDSKPFKCPKSKGKFRVRRQTDYYNPYGSQYYQCSRSRPRLRTCPQQQHFNGRQCVNFRSQRQEFQCPADNGVYPDQRDSCCFWVCRQRVPTRGRCLPQQCGCANTWHQVSGVIIHQDNGNRVIDTWNPHTHQWDRTYNYVSDGHAFHRTEYRNSDPVLYPGNEYYNNQQGIPGYPADTGEARAMAERQLEEGSYYDN